MAKMKGKEPRKGKRIAPPPPLPSTPNYDLEPPVFCFRYLDKTHGLDSCDKDEKAALVSTLYKLSQLSWRDPRSILRSGQMVKFIYKLSKLKRTVQYNTSYLAKYLIALAAPEIRRFH